MPYPTIADLWNDPQRPWPNLIYISTCNYCNARCVCCVNHLIKQPRGIMTLDQFKIIADKIKAHGAMIGAMFCWGEPLMDPTLFDKCAYARQIGVMTEQIGLNTNVSLLTPEKFAPILEHTPNVTLSFFNTEAEYERLTGGLKWDVSYRNALDFIAYRDQHKPEYVIRIGVNMIKGHNLENVERAFAGQRVVWDQDVELRWEGNVLTGPLNRLVTFPDWRCDGTKGCVQVFWNGDCGICAFDIIGNERGPETRYGNMISDDWETLRANFLALFPQGNTLCRRCDYWHGAKTVIANGMRLPDPLPADWNDWQKPYLEER